MRSWISYCALIWLIPGSGLCSWPVREHPSTLELGAEYVGVEASEPIEGMVHRNEVRIALTYRIERWDRRRLAD